MATADTIDSLLNLPDNKIYLPMLVRQMSSAGVVPFVGAGLSAPFGFPQWTKFLLDAAGPVGLAGPIQSLMNEGKYEEAAEQVLTALTSTGFQDLIEFYFGDTVLERKQLTGAIQLIPEISRGPVITTNFDRVLETVFRSANQPFQSEVRASAAKLAIPALQENSRVLLKIHGDWSDPDNRVLTLSEYHKYYGDPDGDIDLDRDLPRLLYLLAVRPVLFLGCSLQQDRTVAIFKHVADKVQSRHFGIVQLPADEAEYRKRREYLLSRNIRPIWYPEGKHQNIEILLRYLVDQLPAHLRITLKPAEERDTIPTPLTSFIGRETERKEVIDLVAKSRLLTLVGAPGSGKTRLAIEVARSVRSDFDHVWFIELSQLAARETRLVAQRVASVLRIYKPGTQSPTEQLAAHLRTGKHLIVIDNCERHVKACATLANTLLRQCPGLKITCTSRRTLDAAGEQLYSVPPLQLPDPEHIPSLKELEELDSVELLVERIRERSYFRLTEENAKAVATLCRGLEGVPLAIELAAAQLQTLSIEEVIARLHQQLKLLTGGTGGEESRQWATLAKAVKLSHELLDSEQALLFRRLSIFHRGWTLEAAASVCSEPHQDEFDILRLLNQLHSMSLMTVEERNGRKRFRLLDFVREYAIERLRDVREDLSLATKHARWFATLAEKAEPELLKKDQAHWLETLALDADNLRGSILHCVANKDAETALRLTGSLWRMMEIRGFYTEGIDRLKAVLAMPEAADFPKLRAKVVSGLGMLVYRQGAMEEAKKSFEECLALEKQLNNPAGIANALNDLGNVAQVTGAFEEARGFYEDCLAMERKAGNTRAIAVALFNLGNIARRLGRPQEATPLLEESLQKFSAEGNLREAAFSLNALALQALSLRDLTTAASYANRSLQIRTDLSEKKGAADTKRTLAAIHLREGNAVRGCELLQECIEVAQQVSDKRGLAEGLELLAEYAMLQDDARLCASLFSAAERLRSEMRLPLAPVELGERNSLLERVRALLGDADHSASWAYGKTLRPEDALAVSVQFRVKAKGN